MKEKFNLKVDNYKTVRDAVFDNLRQGILNGHFKPGERIVESQIAEEMDVSRTPVREAIRRLEIEKLVENLPRKGVIVARLNESQIKEIFDIRGALEGLAVRLAIDNLDDELIVDLENSISNMEKAISLKNIEEQIKWNTNFHECILKKSQSQMLISMLHNLQEQVQRYRHHSLSLEGRPEASVNEHKDILAEIKEKNKYGAELFIRKHIEKAGQLLTKTHIASYDYED